MPIVGRVRRASALLIDARKGGIELGFHGYRVIRQADLPAGVAGDLIELLDRAETYSPEGTGCFVPGAGLSITGEKGSFDLVICLHCRYVDLQSDDSFALNPLSEEGTERLAELMSSVFPELSDAPGVSPPAIR